VATDQNVTSPPADEPVVAPSDSVRPIVAGWFGVVLTAAALLGFGIAIAHTPPDSLGFAALVGTAVLSIALIALIVLSRALGIADAAAALGLPPGSIRALLALGLAIVFVAVASWTLGGLFNPLSRPVVAQVTVPSSERELYRKWYPDSDYIIFETQPDQTPAGAAAGAAPGTPGAAPGTPPGAAPGTPPGAAEQKLVTLKIYFKHPDPALLDLAKQILTISATVLVTVVGFYFGSNSAAEATRTITSLMGLQGGAGGAPPGPSTPPKIDDLQQTVKVIGAIATATNSKMQSLGADPMAPLAAAASKARNKDQAGAQLIAAQKILDDLQKAARACATDADRANEAGAAVRADTPTAQLSQAGTRLQQLLADARQANQDFDAKFSDFTSARDALLQSVTTS
jgi:hypothetical protein